MYRFTSLFPMNSWLRITLDFGDESITVAFKSLTGESTREMPYSEVAIIEFLVRVDLQWANTGACILLLASILVTFVRIPALLGIYPLVFLAGLALYIPSLFQQESCKFFNKNHEYLATVRVTDKNLEDLCQAIELVKSKTVILSETHPKLDRSNGEPKFELTVHFVADYFKTNVMKFYEDKLVDSETSLIEDSLSEYRYADLSGKILRTRQVDSDWSSVGWSIFFWGFFLQTGLLLFLPQFNHRLGASLFIALMILSIFPFVKGFIKDELVFFYDDHGNVLFTIKIPKQEKQKVEEIIRFIETRIPKAPAA